MGTSNNLKVLHGQQRRPLIQQHQDFSEMGFSRYPYDGRLCAIGPRQVYASNDHQQLRDIADAGILYYAQRQRLIEDEG